MQKKIVTFLLIISLFASCKKHVISKIEGEWKMVPLNEYFLDKNVTWNFAEGDNLIITEVATDTTIIDSAKYEIKVNVIGKKTILITDRKSNNGTYLINKLNKSVLKLERTVKDDGESAGAFLWYEFVK
ncbi:MAG: hypothetical protein DRI94_10440 [Bacteroidetes bacterium]|nr:MAG: hypothetical protein DRI94_10440 [Bacteroidota bacterium]